MTPARPAGKVLLVLVGLAVIVAAAVILVRRQTAGLPAPGSRQWSVGVFEAGAARLTSRLGGTSVTPSM